MADTADKKSGLIGILEQKLLYAANTMRGILDAGQH